MANKKQSIFAEIFVESWASTHRFSNNEFQLYVGSQFSLHFVNPKFVKNQAHTPIAT